MKYEIKIAWYLSKNLPVIEQTIGFCDNKKKAYRLIVGIAKMIAKYQTIDYNCIELKNCKRGAIFGKIAIIEHLDKMQRKYGPFYTHPLVLGKPKNL